MACVYLIHFETPYVSPGPRPKVISHYLGATALPLARRIARHRSGDGARLLRAATAKGIAWRVVRTWRAHSRTHAFHLEVALKRARRHKSLCPVCTPAKEATACAA